MRKRADPYEALTPLHSAEAEMSALGSMLFSNSCADAGIALLREHWFFVPGLRVIFAAIAELRARSEAVDLVTVKRELASHNLLEEAGSEDGLIRVAESEPSPANLEHYARIVGRLHTLRTIRHNAAVLVKGIDKAEITQTEEAVAASARICLDGEMPWSYSREMGAIDVDFPPAGIPTPWAPLNRLSSCRGLPSSDVTSVEAKSGKGKSLFMSTLISAIGGTLYPDVEMGTRYKRCFYATFGDLNDEWIKRRMACHLCGMTAPPEQPLQADLLGDWESTKQLWRETLEEIEDWNITTYDASLLRNGADVDTFVGWVRAEHQRRPFAAGAVDYAGVLRCARVVGERDTREQAEVAWQLSQLARQTGIALLVAVQINEDGSTRGSKDYVHHAGWRLFIDDERGRVEVKKSRYGPEQRYAQIKLDRRYLYFEEWQ